MGSNRFNKPAPAAYKPKAEKEVEVKLDFKPCLTCGKPITGGYYGRWEEGGTCSKKCESAQEDKSWEAKERNHGHSMETHS